MVYDKTPGDKEKYVMRQANFIRPVRVVLTLICSVGVAAFGLGGLGSFAEAAACSAASNNGTDTVSVSVPATTTYTVWARIKVPSTANDAMDLQIDKTTCFNVGGSSSIPANTWTWVDYQNGATSKPNTVSLTAGTHTLESIGTDAGVSVDRIILNSDPGCVPSGTGNNCASDSGTSVSVTPKSSGSTNPSGGSTNYSGGSQSNGSATSGAGSDMAQTVGATPSSSSSVLVSRVEFYLNGKLIATVITAPYTYTINTHDLRNGTYTLKTVTYYSDGTSNTKDTSLVVKNPFGLTQLRLELWHYLWLDAIVLVLLIIIIKLIRRKRHHDDPNGMNMDNTGGNSVPGAGGPGTGIGPDPNAGTGPTPGANNTGTPTNYLPYS
jgi:hypothetical protein